MARGGRGLVAVAVAALLVASCGPSQVRADRPDDRRPSAKAEEAHAPEGPALPRLEGITTTTDLDVGESLEAWQGWVPRIEDVRITSTWDGADQPAMWLPPRGEGPAPLLVVLHSWSHTYQQHWGIPYGQWAELNGWALIHPDFRGAFRTQAATGSDVAVRDVLDAIDFAVGHESVDDRRVYVIGFSGGGMMSLLMAGRHPERVAGAVSWVPIHDLGAWHGYNRLLGTLYTHQIEESCGGDPTSDAVAALECAWRSPQSHLDAARTAEVPVYLGHGLHDDLVPAHHTIAAFNQLAAPGDHLPGDVVDAARSDHDAATPVGDEGVETYFATDEPDVVLARRSGPVTVVVFDGDHEMLYHPGLAWLAELARSPAAERDDEPDQEGDVSRR
jgi:dienelactone hydrolase